MDEHGVRGARHTPRTLRLTAAGGIAWTGAGLAAGFLVGCWALEPNPAIAWLLALADARLQGAALGSWFGFASYLLVRSCHFALRQRPHRPDSVAEDLP